MICHSCLTMDPKKIIKLKCGHSICQDCCMRVYSGLCPTCKQKMVFEIVMDNFDERKKELCCCNFIFYLKPV